MEAEEKPNILIVDDLEMNLSYLEEVIKPLNVNLIKALSGKEALENIRDKELALALIDVQMPVMDGLQLAKILHSDTTRDLVPVIFITAHTYYEYHLEEYYATGIIDFLFKPFQKSILLSKIRILLELNRQKNLIRESEKMYRTLLNASPEGIIIINSQRVITELSDMTCEIFGLSGKEHFTGLDIGSLFPPEEFQHLNELLDKTVREGKTHNVEFLLTRANQTKFICEISTTLIQFKENGPVTIMAILRDISQRKQMEQKLIHTERMASLGEMAAGIAHEINQPLNTISMGLENLLNEIRKARMVDEVYFHKKAEKIFDNIARLDYIIDHIRTFSRSNDGDIRSFFNVNDSIRDGISMVSGQFRQKGIELVTELDDSIPQVIGNTFKFEQVIINLLVNSKDAVEEKQKSKGTDYTKIVVVKSYLKDQSVCVEVRDNGIGIQPAELDKIMLPFHTTKEPGRGTGLGLSISFGIINEMGGSIKVTSALTTGTTLKITIPVRNDEKTTRP